MSALSILCEKLGIKAECKYGTRADSKGQRWPAGSHHYKVTLRFGRRRLTTDFTMGPALTKEPTAADVLSCLMLDATVEGSFEDFCSDLGYDSDSREAEAIYKSCARIAPRVRRFLGDSFNKVAQAEH